MLTLSSEPHAHVHILTGACNAVFVPPPGLEDVLDSSSAVTTCAFRPPPGLEDVLKDTRQDESCFSTHGSSHRWQTEDAVNAWRDSSITRCTLLALRIACEVDGDGDSLGRPVIKLMHRDELQKHQHASSKPEISCSVGYATEDIVPLPHSLGACRECKTKPFGDFEEDLEASSLPCSNQPIRDMHVSLLNGKTKAAFTYRRYLLFTFIGMLVIILGGYIAMALCSSPEDTQGRLRPFALFILRAEVGLREHFSRTQNAPSFLAPMYEQLLPSSPAGPVPVVSSVQINAAV